MQVRQAIPEDKQYVLELARSFATSFAVEDKAFGEVFDNLLDQENVTFIVAEEDRQVVGYCLAFHHETFFANGLVTWVEEIMIDENFRGKHVGSLLMENIETTSRSKKSKLIALATRRANKFYENVGYEESATYYRKLL